MDIPSDYEEDIISEGDLNFLFDNLQNPEFEVIHGILNDPAEIEPKDSKPSDAITETESEPSIARSLSSPNPDQWPPGNFDVAPWVQENQTLLKQALGIGHNKPGPRPGHKKGKIFKKELNKARGCPVKMAKVREKHRHLFEGNCRRAMEQRFQMVFQQLLADPEPALAAKDPLVDFDVQFALEYYDIDLVALATPPEDEASMGQV